MAVTAVLGSPAGALNYTFTTDTSADWASVANSTYFYDKADKLVHFKNASGTVLEIFAAEGNSTVPTSYSTLKRGISITNDTAIVTTYSFKIDANKITSDTLLEVSTTLIRNAATNSARIQYVMMYNTTNTVSGAIFLAQFLDLPVGQYFAHNIRSIFLDYAASKLKTFYAGDLYSNDLAKTLAPVTVSVNFAADMYIIFAVKNDSLSDISTADYIQITSNNSII